MNQFTRLLCLASCIGAAARVRGGGGAQRGVAPCIEEAFCCT
jgi:hypothetical protein